MSSSLFGDNMVRNIEQDYILLLGRVFYIRDIILLGLTTKKNPLLKWCLLKILQPQVPLIMHTEQFQQCIA